MLNIEPITNPSFLGNAVLAVPPEPFLKLQDSKNTSTTTETVSTNSLKLDSYLNLPENLKATIYKNVLQDETSNKSDSETLLLIRRIPRSSQIRCLISQWARKSEKKCNLWHLQHCLSHQIFFKFLALCNEILEPSNLT